jgi:hypothetical protein
MISKDEFERSRASVLGLLRRKLAQELDAMGYPGGHLETGSDQRPIYPYTGQIVDAGSELSSQKLSSAFKEHRGAEQR